MGLHGWEVFPVRARTLRLFRWEKRDFFSSGDLDVVQ